MLKAIARFFSAPRDGHPVAPLQHDPEPFARLSPPSQREQLEAELENAGRRHDEILKGIVLQHARVLSKKIRQAIRQDEYGKDIGLEEAGEAFSYFMSRVAKVEPEYLEARQRVIDINLDIALYGRDRNEYDLDGLSEKMGAELDENLIGYVYTLATSGSSRPVDNSAIDGLSGEEFELHCEQRLRSLGWTVNRKAGTGDQGVDLLASKEGTIVAIQCKRYTGSVGNQAVQQVEAGRQYEEADVAAVVSNSAYTQSAQQLAERVGVILMHANELDLLDQRVRNARHTRT